MTFWIYLFLLIVFLCLWLIPQSQMGRGRAYCEFDDNDGDAAENFHAFMSRGGDFEDQSNPFE